MKRLYLIRHAKSSWKNPALADFDRPLNKRGKRDAPFMGKLLAKQKVRCDLILTSPAKRAFNTAKIIAKEIGFPKKKIVTDEAIYLMDTQTLVEVIKHIDDSVNRLMMFGHNPGFTILANYLSDYKVENIPTCGIFCIDFDISSWSKVSEGNGIFQFFDYPKKYL